MKSTNRRELAIAIGSLILLLSIPSAGLAAGDITPQWWKSLPVNVSRNEKGEVNMETREPTCRAAWLLLPWIVAVGIYFAAKASTGDGWPVFFSWVFGPYLAAIALAIVEAILLAIFSYGITGTVSFLHFEFLIFSNLCLLIAIAMIGLTVLLGKLFSSHGFIKRSLGLIGLVIEGFGVILTVRDIFTFFASF